MAELHKRDYRRERKIVQLYNLGYTYAHIGKVLDISKVRVGQIYRRLKQEGALKKIMSS